MLKYYLKTRKKVTCKCQLSLKIGKHHFRRFLKSESDVVSFIYVVYVVYVVYVIR